MALKNLTTDQLARLIAWSRAGDVHAKEALLNVYNEEDLHTEIGGGIQIPGPQGIQGPPGPDGPRGPAGAAGATGPQGPRGFRGAKGDQGPKGDTGLTGPAGAPGDKYLAESSTSLTISDDVRLSLTINTGRAYSALQGITVSHDSSNHMHAVVVSYDSATGVLVFDVTDATGAGTYDYWVVNLEGAVGAPGPKGDSGAPAEWYFHGGWSDLDDYVKGDIVVYGGECWYSNGNISVNQPPGVGDWTKIAAKGDTGEEGPQGNPGQTGPAGADGATGPSGVAFADSPLLYDSLTKTVSIQKADTTHSGYISSFEFNSFSSVSGKADSSIQVLGTGGLEGGGDLTTSRNIYMPNVGTPGTYGSSSQVASVTTDAKGRISSASNVSISIPSSQIPDLSSTVTGIINTSNATKYRLIGYRTLLAGTASYTPSSGTTHIDAVLIGAGGGGGGAVGIANQSACGGGGGAGSVVKIFAALDGSPSYTTSIKTGGAGGTGNNAGNSTSGSTTLTIGASVFAAGCGKGGTQGASGTTASSAAYGGDGGSAGAVVVGTYTIALPGQPGQAGVRLSASAGIAGAGGSTMYGVGGLLSTVANNGSNGPNGAGYGSGGSGGYATGNTNSDKSGGNGADGVIIIAEYA